MNHCISPFGHQKKCRANWFKENKLHNLKILPYSNIWKERASHHVDGWTRLFVVQISQVPLLVVKSFICVGFNHHSIQWKVASITCKCESLRWNFTTKHESSISNFATKREMKFWSRITLVEWDFEFKVLLYGILMAWGRASRNNKMC